MKSKYTLRNVPRTEIAGWYRGPIMTNSAVHIEALCEPLEGACGDYVGVFQLRDKRLAIVIADACGHGQKASAILRAVEPMEDEVDVDRVDPSRLLSSVSTAMIRQGTLRDGKFITAAIMIIDPRSGIAEVALAGHPPPIILRNKKLIDFRIEPGFPLGILPDVQADNVSIHLITGDTIAFYSDGVADATCNMGDFNKARAMLVDAAESPTPAAHLINLLDQRRDHSWLQDDTTAVFLKYKNDAMLE